MYVLIYLPIFNSIFNKSNLRMSIGYLQPLVTDMPKVQNFQNSAKRTNYSMTVA